VNEGRGIVNSVPRNIGANPDPATIKFSGKEPYEV
jgi:photosystem I subunit 2